MCSLTSVRNSGNAEGHVKAKLVTSHSVAKGCAVCLVSRRLDNHGKESAKRTHGSQEYYMTKYRCSGWPFAIPDYVTS